MTHQVIKSFLADEQWSLTAAGFERIIMQPVHSSGLQHVYAFGDGVSYHSTDAVIDLPLGDNDPDLDGVLPSLRAFAAALIVDVDVRSFLEKLGGWSSLTIRAYLYPSGSGLTWHTDRKCVAAYVYYAHERWEPSWGGELLIDQKGQSEVGCGATVDSKLYPRYPGLSASSGSFFFPIPNSLVLLQGGTPHCVKRVEPAAGNRARASVSGFFYRD